MEITGTRAGLAARASLTTEAICSLPAVPTQDWCDDAASAIAQGLPGFVIGVAIGDLTTTGEVRRLEACGAGGGDAARVDAMSARMATIERLGSPGSAAPTIGARRDADSQAPGLVGSSPIAPERPGRVVIVEVCPLEAGAGFTPEDEATLGSALAPLARRARIAFGDEPLAPRQMLTPRERDVLTLLITGMSVREIAANLCRSPHTVHDYVKSLRRKLAATSRGGLVARALGRSLEPREDAPVADGDERASREMVAA